MSDRRASRAEPAPRRAWIGGVCAALLALTGSGAPLGAFDAGTAHAQPDIRWLPGGWSDYAPGGLPDFSQCRAGWGWSGSPGQWTYAGPVAVADALWWLDSVAEPEPHPPPTPHDGHALVTAYPVFGPARDDHGAANVVPLVEDLALRANTDGRRSAGSHRGTRWEELVAAVERYVADRGLADVYAAAAVSAPDRRWLVEHVERGAAIVLLLGVWEDHVDGPKRVGGHYAAVAGIAPDGDGVAISDPLGDAAADGGAGRVAPPDPAPHGCRTSPAGHDDAGVFAHDEFRLAPDVALPGRRAVLADYFTPDNAGEAAAFQRQNPAGDLAPFAADWLRGDVRMAVDAALAVYPRVPPGPTPTPSATPAPTRSITPTPSATASGTPLPTSTATNPPSATAPPATAGQRAAHLPFAKR